MNPVSLYELFSTNCQNRPFLARDEGGGQGPIVVTSGGNSSQLALYSAVEGAIASRLVTAELPIARLARFIEREENDTAALLPCHRFVL